jgi:hypothetical protein
MTAWHWLVIHSSVCCLVRHKSNIPRSLKRSSHIGTLHVDLTLYKGRLARLVAMPQLKHSMQSINDRAINPPPGKGREEVDEHMARHVEAGWTLAFYSTNATATGTMHHFIWQGPERIYA